MSMDRLRVEPVRRTSVRRALASIAGMALLLCTAAALGYWSIPQTAKAALERQMKSDRTGRLMRLHVWADMHVSTPTRLRPTQAYYNAQAKAIWAMEAANGRHGIESADMVVSVGDMIHGEDLAQLAPELANFRKTVLGPLAAPYLPCLGNHENIQGEGIEENNLPYDRVFGRHWHNYIALWRGVAFMVVDSSGGHMDSGPATDQREAFIRRAFEKIGRRPTIVITHIPLVPMRDDQTLKSSFGFPSYVNQDPRLLALIEQHADTVIAVISGHLHLSAARHVRGIWHINSGGTASFPGDILTLDVYPSRIDLQMVALPAELDRPFESDIHGRRRHGVDYTDKDHPTHELYMRGNPSERTLAIELAGGKTIQEGLAEPLAVWLEESPGYWITHTLKAGLQSGRRAEKK